MRVWAVYMEADPDATLFLASSWDAVCLLHPGLPNDSPAFTGFEWRDGLGDRWVARLLEVAGA